MRFICTNAAFKATDYLLIKIINPTITIIMSEIKNGDLPASPTTMEGAHGSTINTFGLTKREIFAMAAMQGICANPQILINAKNSGKPIDEDGTAVTDAIARVSVQQADALLTQLSKQQ